MLKSNQYMYWKEHPIYYLHENIRQTPNMGIALGVNSTNIIFGGYASTLAHLMHNL
jgi:hypothetical protein